jgi:hypothetical protein
MAMQAMCGTVKTQKFHRPSKTGTEVNVAVPFRVPGDFMPDAEVLALMGLLLLFLEVHLVEPCMGPRLWHVPPATSQPSQPVLTSLLQTTSLVWSRHSSGTDAFLSVLVFI